MTNGSFASLQHPTSFVVDGNNPSTTLENIGQVNGTSFSFVVNFASGTSLELNLRDSTGAAAASGAFPVQAGTSSACVSTSASAGSSTTGSTASTTAGGSSTTSDTSSASSTTTTDSTSGHALITSGSFATPTTPTSNAAAGLTAQFSELGVAAGVVGAVMAAFALQIVG
ncbi:hypothetical protein SCHPADRAFT_936209 [Schizopora paradoxa]|uniref:Uncharacterized protein n=1 Tax=Schizopora paradoxa TaxID=27342 RepID=A0A0H2S1X0_9AGAM|nr:hypothetical protein SCHPADRAFT_936209 [Schizopora paradoxa]